MKIIYANSKVQKQCSSVKAARQLFGGNTILSISLLSRINALESAVILKDIIVQPSFHFHNLKGKMAGWFAIDVKGRADKWRILLRPVDKDNKPYEPCNIDELAGTVKIVEIKEVSPHYE